MPEHGREKIKAGTTGQNVKVQTTEQQPDAEQEGNLGGFQLSVTVRRKVSIVVEDLCLLRGETTFSDS
jgi:hypothetical protein